MVHSRKNFLLSALIVIITISFLSLPKTFAGVLDQFKDENSIMPATASIDDTERITVSSSSSIFSPNVRREIVPVYDSNGRRIGLMKFIYYYDSEGRLIRSRYSKSAQYEGGNLTEESDEVWKYNKLGQLTTHTITATRKGVDEKGNVADSYSKKQETKQWNKAGLVAYMKTEETIQEGDTDLTQVTEERFGYNDKGLLTNHSKSSKIEGITKDGDIADETTIETETKQYNSEGKVVKEKTVQTRQTGSSDITEEITKSYVYNADGLVGKENYTKTTSGINTGIRLDETISGTKNNQYDAQDRLVKQNVNETKRTGTDITIQNSVKTLAYDAQGNITNINSTINQTGTKEGKQVNTTTDIDMSAQASTPEAFKKAITEFLTSANISGIDSKFISKITTEDKIAKTTTTVLQGVEEGNLTEGGIESGIVRLELNYEGKSVDKSKLKEVFTYNYEEGATGKKLLMHKDKYNASGVYQGLEGYKYDSKNRLTIAYEEDVKGNQTVKFANKYDANGGRKTYSADGYIYLYNSSDQLTGVITPEQDIYLMGSNGKVNVVVTATGEVFKLNDAGQVAYMYNGSTLTVFENGTLGQDTGEIIERNLSYDGYGNILKRATGRLYTNINGNQATENIYLINNRIGGFGVSSWFETRATGTVTLSEDMTAFVAGYSEFIAEGADLKQDALGTSSALLVGGLGYQVGSLMNIYASHHEDNEYIAYYDGWWYGVRESVGSSMFTLAPGQTVQEGVDNILVQKLSGYVQNSSGGVFDKSKDYLVLSSDEADRLGAKLTAAGIKYVVKDTSVAGVEKSPESLYLYAQQGPRSSTAHPSGWIEKPRPPADGMDAEGNLIFYDVENGKVTGATVIGGGEVGSAFSARGTGSYGIAKYGTANNVKSDNNGKPGKTMNDFYKVIKKDKAADKINALIDKQMNSEANKAELNNRLNGNDDSKAEKIKSDFKEEILEEIGIERFVGYADFSAELTVDIDALNDKPKFDSIRSQNPADNIRIANLAEEISENIGLDGAFQSQSELFQNHQQLVTKGTVFKLLDSPYEFLAVTLGSGVLNNSLESNEQKSIDELNDMSVKF